MLICPFSLLLSEFIIKKISRISLLPVSVFSSILCYNKGKKKKKNQKSRLSGNAYIKDSIQCIILLLLLLLPLSYM